MNMTFLKEPGSGGRQSARRPARAPARHAISIPPAPEPADWVNPLQGTDSHHAFSTGNTLPLVALPHAMVAWTPQTDEGRWIYDLRAPKLQAFRATHQPSPWMADYGQFMVMATSGDRPPAGYDDTASSYHRDTVRAHPHLFHTVLHRFGIEAEIAPTERGGCFRFTYREGAHAWLAFKLGAGDSLRVDRDHRRVYGVSTANSGGVPGNFGSYFVAEIGAQILGAGSPAPAPERTGAWLWLKIRRPAGRQVTVRISTSFIGEEQAVLNLRRELGRRSFDEVAASAREIWNHRLSVITLDGASVAQLRTFYSCLYRCLLFPRIWHELDADGNRIHFSPFSGKVHPGPLYTDIGFWDVHRALMPLLTIIAPDLLGDIIEGWNNIYREGGWLPNWASPGYRDCMIGTHSNVVIADAFAKGIRNFDVATAYEAVRKDALVEPTSTMAGRTGLDDYIRLGYVPADRVTHSVARTTDYAYCDSALATFAHALGHAKDAELFRARAGNYRKVFDHRTGFLRGRNAAGTWRTPFREFEWSSDYIEGGAWQHTWSVPHDAASLIALMGGNRAFVEKLDHMLALPPRFETGNYATEIHEMTEMAAAPFGQYAHSNQPVHHVLYLYTCAGRPDRTQHWVRRVLNELYSEDAFPGDEDNGAMSAWYVLSSLGFYPVTVGHPEYVLGAPLFPKATIHLSGGRTFVVTAKGGSEAACFVENVHLNGARHRSLALPHATISAGGTLDFQMTDRANLAAKRGRLEPPYSMSTWTASTRPRASKPADAAPMPQPVVRLNGEAVHVRPPRVART